METMETEINVILIWMGQILDNSSFLFVSGANILREFILNNQDPSFNKNTEKRIIYQE